MAGFLDPLEPEIELDLLGTPWLIADYTVGLLSVAQTKEVARLKALLALTNFLLESAADEALSAHRECEKLTVELARRKSIFTVEPEPVMTPEKAARAYIREYDSGF